LTGIN